MVRFIFTMNMGSYKGRIVHQVIADVDVRDVDELLALLNDNDFIAVDQYYNVNDEEASSQDWRYKGRLIMNTGHIGKVQQYMDNAPAVAVSTQRRAPFKR